MSNFLFIFFLIPFTGFILNAFISSDKEKWLANSSIFTISIQLITTLIYTIYWTFYIKTPLITNEFILLHIEHFKLSITFNYEEITSFFLLVGSLLAFLITKYSRTYLHREKGFKRFFTTIMLFYLGYNVIVLSANFNTMFIGWEISGIASFLLIAYYRNRYIPVKNAVKIFSVYRLGDLSFLILIWLTHKIWNYDINLNELTSTVVYPLLHEDNNYLIIVFCILILFIASIKSAQVPFSSWLPRAMEGPTPSSAIFYGSLASHIGVLLLLKTQLFWIQIEMVKYIIIFYGLLSFTVNTIISRVQTNIKGQIAYSSSAQIGLMFFEIAIGLKWLVLIHFAGNAFLRSYQLLLSPSIVTYLIREQFYNATKQIYNRFLPKKIEYTFYILSLKEWYMDDIMHHSIWNVFKLIGKKTHFLPFKVLLVLSVFFIIQSYLSFYFLDYYYFNISIHITLVFVFVLSVWAFTEKENPLHAFTVLLLVHLVLYITLNLYYKLDILVTLVYFSSLIIFYLIGLITIIKLIKIEESIHLKSYQGHCFEHPIYNSVFFIISLALLGFPISGVFAGIETIFSKIETYHIGIIIILSLTILVNSLSYIRIYTRIFLGPHIKTYHESARKSS